MGLSKPSPEYPDFDSHLFGEIADVLNHQNYDWLAGSPNGAPTTPLNKVIEGLNFQDFPVPPVVPNSNIKRRSVRTSDQQIRRLLETTPIPQGFFPLPPGLTMIWDLTHTIYEPHEVIQQPDETGQLRTVLEIRSTPNRPPYFRTKPQGGEKLIFHEAIARVAPYLIGKITRPSKVSQIAFERATASLYDNLNTILTYIDYSQEYGRLTINGDNFGIISQALDHIALALSSIAVNEKQMQAINHALQADINLLG